MLDVLVLGAGASLGAREDFDTPPPLGQGLAAYLIRWLEANDPELSPTAMRVPLAVTANPIIVGPGPWQDRDLLGEVCEALGAVAEDDARSEKPHFEGLMGRWAAESLRYRKHLELTQRLLTYSMNFGHQCAFLEKPDRFDHLLAAWKPSVIVTLNYDLLVEQALGRLSLRHSHPAIPALTPNGLVSEGSGDIVPLFKLHGSVNWLPIRGGARGATLAIVDEQAKQNPTTPRMSGSVMSDDTKATYESPNSASLRFASTSSAARFQW